MTAKSKNVEPSALGLRRIKLFDGVAQATLEQLAAQCRWRNFRSGQRLISRDATDQDVYMVVSGRLRVTSFSASGRQVTYRDLSAGDWFGDFAAIDGGSRSADVVALENALVASVGPAVFRNLLHEHPSVCDRMLNRLVASVRELTERVFDLSTLGVQNRVHAEILRLARLAGVKSNVAKIEPIPKHGDIASQVSTYREQVTRELSAMVKRGLVQRAGRALIVPDVARLEKLVADVRRSP